MVTLTPVTLSILGLVILGCLGVYWWIFFRNTGNEKPTILVEGFYPSGPHREMRELEISDGMVRWDRGEDEQDLDIALDGQLTIPDIDSGKRIALVDVERGIQFLPNLPPEGVEYEQSSGGVVQTRRIDGRILAAKRDDISVSRWRQTRSDWREDLVRYLPWILGLIAVVLMGILYWMIKFVPVSEPVQNTPGPGSPRQAGLWLSLLWMTRPTRWS